LISPYRPGEKRREVQHHAAQLLGFVRDLNMLNWFATCSDVPQFVTTS
jgi:hypothetical protein